jgi:hypothetical protein
MQSKEQLEKDLKVLYDDLFKYQELNKKGDMGIDFNKIISYISGQINCLNYVLGHIKELR